MFSTVLVANRGEIAVRVIRSLRAMGIRSVAVYSDADVDARHVHDADVAVRLGPAAAAESYLSVERVLAAAVATGAEALHPGYGFLSENPALPRACAAQGIVFVGPPVEAIVTMGDKIRARHTVAAAGVAVVPGDDRPELSDAELETAALAVGLPVIVKPSAGGGGRGMRVVHEAAALRDAIAGARREAAGAFGDDRLFVERYLDRPRHIEIQVAGDLHGNLVHLGERECSLQRRHQKVVEEAPSPFVTPRMRAAMGDRAVTAARACGYSSVGTVEFIVAGDRPDDFFFMEMNTRLQVEHPVTELVYGVDLVEVQLRIAAGEALPFHQDALQPRGHAVEARIYAEDPSRGFLPTGGTVGVLREPAGAEGVRVDSGLRVDTVVGPHYDPMLAKVIAVAPTRHEALRRLDGALASTVVLGVATNIAFLRRLLADEDVRAGVLDTGLVERIGWPEGTLGAPDAVLATAALLSVSAGAAGANADPWLQSTGWRHGGHAPLRFALQEAGGGRVDVGVTACDGVWKVTVEGGGAVDATVRAIGDDAILTYDGVASSYAFHRAGGSTWLGAGGSTWRVDEVDPWSPLDGARANGSGPVRAPMPGTVVAVAVHEGQAVTAGQRLAVVEAMKMEHVLTAGADGVVAGVLVAEGQQVAMDQIIVIVEARAEGRQP